MLADAKVDILLVDDNPANMIALEAMLDDLGQNLVKAGSGAEALKRILERDFALILMDVHMPDMDGLETASIIRSRQRSMHIPIVFLTAFSRTDEQIVKGYSIGAVDFLFKPIVPEILRSKVSVFVDLAKKTEEVKRQAQLLREAAAREHDRELEEARRIHAAALLREEMEHERRIAEAQSLRAYELMRAESALKRSNERLQLLAETASQLLLGTKPEELVDDLYRRFSAHLDLEVYLNYLVDQDGETLRLASYGGLDVEGVQVRRFGEGICGMVAVARAPIVREDLSEDDDPHHDYLRLAGVTAYACYPLLAGGRLFGTLSFGTRRKHSFQSDELQVMQVVSDQVAIALERSRLIAELSRRASDLAEADARKDEFLAMLAHELRNPLAPMMNAVHTLRLGMDGNEAWRRAISAMDRQLKHMVRLVDDLLDVSRIERGKIELRQELVNLGPVVEHAVQTSRPLIEERRHRLTVTLPLEPIELVADPTRLAQVIANLLNNAAKYTDPDGSIELFCEHSGGDLLIHIRDNGMGLSAEMRSRVFDLFVQCERTVDRAQGGLGIGLTLVRSIVEMHGGSVTAQSEGVGRGSDFIVRLPLPESLPKGRSLPPPPMSMPLPAAGRARRVVLVEDNEDSRETLKDLLEMRGHQVSEAADGLSGVEMTLELRPDVALIDVGLPKLDGYGVARRLRAEMPAPHKTRLIALTGYGQPEDRRRALEAGFDAHIVKPIDFTELTRLLDEAP